MTEVNSKFIDQVGLRSVVDNYYNEWVNYEQFAEEIVRMFDIRGLLPWSAHKDNKAGIMSVLKHVVRYYELCLPPFSELKMKREWCDKIAWLCAHALLFPELEISVSEMTDMIPIGQKEYIESWNISLGKQYDVPRVIKHMLKLDSNAIPMMMLEDPKAIVERFRNDDNATDVIDVSNMLAAKLLEHLRKVNPNLGDDDLLTSLTAISNNQNANLPDLESE